MKTFFFSIIIPTKNRFFSINKTIKSLAAQTYKNFEVIVVNDDSDYEYAIDPVFFENLNLKFIDNIKEKGRSGARNRGIEKSSSEYLIFLDDDDLFEQNYLQNLFEQINLNENFDADILYTNYNIASLVFSGKEYCEIKNEFFETPEFSVELLAAKNFIPIISAVFKKNCFENISFNPLLNCIEDWELFINLYSQKFKFKKLNIKGTIYCFRNDRTNSTSSEFDIFYKSRKIIIENHNKFFSNFPDTLQLHKEYLEEYSCRYENWIEFVNINGFENLIIKDNCGKEFLIHSKYNPETEAKRQIEKFNFENTIIIIGAGMGYKLSALAEIFEDKKIILIEPDSRIYNHAKQITYSKINNRNIIFINNLNLEDLIYKLENILFKNEKISYSIFEPLKKIYNVYFDKIEEYLKKNYVAYKI